MAIQLISVKCPECGAVINIEEDREKAYCSYCGAKILIHDDTKHTYKHIFRDEARLAEAEAEKEITLRKIALLEREKEEQLREKEKKRLFREKQKRLLTRILIISSVICFLTMIMCRIIEPIAEPLSFILVISFFIAIVVGSLRICLWIEDLKKSN